jgi:hypothetical protein
MNKWSRVFGALAGIVSAILLTTGRPSFGDVVKSGCFADRNAATVTRGLPWKGDQSVKNQGAGCCTF